MDVKALKGKILQLAIQGKLVKQNINDESALVLLEKIKEEKKRIIQNNKIKKEVPLEDIKDEEKPFELPIGWQWVRLGEISEYIQRGKSPKYSNVEKYPVIAQKCVQWSGVSLEKALFIEPDSIIKYGEERFLVHGDLLWNSTGTGSCGRIGKFTDSIRNGFDKIVADSHITVIRCFKQYINYEYLFIWLSSPEVQSVIESRASGSTNQIELSTVTIKNYLISLPPLEEQRRIIEKVNESFNIIDKLDSNRQGFSQNITYLRNKILQLAIQGKLVEQNEQDEPASILLQRISENKKVLIKDKKLKKEKILPLVDDKEKVFDLPKNWEWCRIGMVLELLTDYHANGGYKILKDNVKLFDKEDYAIMVRITNLGTNAKDDYKYVNEHSYNFLAKSKLYKDDIVMSKITDPGTVYLVPEMNKPMSLAMNLFLLRVYDVIDSKYIYLYLRARERYVKSFQAGTSTKTITKDAVKALVLALPPVNEQKRIVEKVDMLMSYLEELENSILG